MVSLSENTKLSLLCVLSTVMLADELLQKQNDCSKHQRKQHDVLKYTSFLLPHAPILLLERAKLRKSTSFRGGTWPQIFNLIILTFQNISSLNKSERNKNIVDMWWVLFRFLISDQKSLRQMKLWLPRCVPASVCMYNTAREKGSAWDCCYNRTLNPPSSGDWIAFYHLELRWLYIFRFWKK